MSDYPMLISNKLHSFRNFVMQSYVYLVKNLRFRLEKTHFGVLFLDIIKVQGVGESAFLEFLIWLINIKLLLLHII